MLKFPWFHYNLSVDVDGTFSDQDAFNPEVFKDLVFRKRLPEACRMHVAYRMSSNSHKIVEMTGAVQCLPPWHPPASCIDTVMVGGSRGFGSNEMGVWNDFGLEKHTLTSGNNRKRFS